MKSADLKFHIGCQMNDADSAVMGLLLEREGVSDFGLCVTRSNGCDNSQE